MGKRTKKAAAPARADRAFRAVSLCFLLSGIAGLVYQMVWMRYLSTIFGTSELAIVTVLVAYMGGLAVGAWCASRLVGKMVRPILVYAILEAVIAASALLVPLLLRAVGGLHRAFLGGQDAPPPDGGLVEALAFLGLGCLVLLIPTACMGATLPILASGVVRTAAQIGKRVGWLYALNTVGAVFGTVLAAFVFIPALGLWQTSFVGVILNLSVAVIGWRVARRAGSAGVEEDAGKEQGKRAKKKAEEAVSVPASAFLVLILAVMLLSGAVSFAYEVLWSRLLAHVLGGSLYAFATMLASFLAGIALGGVAGARLAVNRTVSCYGLAAVEILTGILSALIFFRVSSEEFAKSGADTIGSMAFLAAMTLMPATVCIGATFPLAVRSLTENPHAAGASAGRVYAWNTIGAILGAVAAGYFLIPALGFAVTFKLAIVVNLLLGLAVLAAMRPRLPVPLGAAALVTLGFLVFYQPRPPLVLLTRSPVAAEGPGAGEPVLLHHAVGHSATVALLERRGSYLLRTNGLPEAEIFRKGADKLSYTGIRWLPALPVVLRPETKSMLVVGFGGGALLEAVPEAVKRIDVVELEAEVIRANELIADRRAIDPLADDRLNVIVNDVRGALRLTDRVYDAIVSQPSHPWTAGASHLYTREFLELAGRHLSDEGIFVQWLGSHFVNEDLLRSFMGTVRAVFPHTQLYLMKDNFLFVGSRAPIDATFLSHLAPGESLFELSGYAKISYPEDLLAVLQLDEEGCRKLAGEHPAITDNRNLMATFRTIGKGEKNAMNDPANVKRVIGPLHYLEQEASVVLQRLAGRKLDYRYLGGLLQGTARHVDLAALRARHVPPAQRKLLDALTVRQEDPAAALQLLAQAREADPEDAGVRGFEAQTRLVLARRSWVAQQRGPLPAEFAAFLQSDSELQAAVTRLPPAQRAAAEAEYWLQTGQAARVATHEAVLRAFVDHRDPYYQVAAQSLVRYHLDPAGKSAEEAEAGARRAAEILDHLLALPLVNNVALLTQRLALAQRFGEIDYQVAAGWIMARRLASAPPNAPASMRTAVQGILGAILKPYLQRSEKGRIGFTEPEIAEFYREVKRQIGSAVFPEEYRR